MWQGLRRERGESRGDHSWSLMWVSEDPCLFRDGASGEDREKQSGICGILQYLEGEEVCASPPFQGSPPARV